MPRIARFLSDSFLRQRAIWFALDGAFIAAALVVVARWIGGRAGLVAGLLAPTVWISLPMLVTWQTRNFHLVTMAGAMLAMVAFEQERGR